MTGGRGAWAIVVPVKRLAIAKTRLSVTAELRAELAMAMALDTVRAALAAGQVGRVVAVTDEIAAGAALAELGAEIVADEPDAGLNAALTHGAAVASRSRGGDGPVAALAADLPALRGDELAGVLALALDARAAVVADAAGAGTTLLAAPSASALTPAFGPGSRRAHVETGAVDLTGRAGASVRRDVDTLSDLAAAADLGLGPACRELLDRHPELLR